MGQGGYLLLKNKTPYRWRKTHKHSWQMKSWDNSFPEVIEPNSFAHVYIEWQEGAINTKDDGGEIDYTMEGVNAVFQIQARAKNGFVINIQCKNFSTTNIQHGATISLGWWHNNSLVFMIGGGSGRFTSLGSQQIANQWMRNLDNRLKISQLTIPGTHDSCAYDMSSINYMYLLYLINILPTIDPVSIILKTLANFAAPIAVDRFKTFTRCQDMSIEEQLAMGIRSLDIRLKNDGGHLKAYHGPVEIPLTFSQIAQTCYDFLRANPSETIIASIKNEGDGDKPIDALVTAEINAHKQTWYTEKTIPALGDGSKAGDARGKLVLMRRYASHSAATGMGINVSDIWPDNTQKENIVNSDKQLFSIQDEYRDYILTELDHKFLNHVKPFLKETANTLFINFTSGVGFTGGFVFPKTLAKGKESLSTFQGTNKLLFDHVLGKMTEVYGIIPMDFPEYPNNSLIPLLISCNSF